jgi:hypothetical protein
MYQHTDRRTRAGEPAIDGRGISQIELGPANNQDLVARGRKPVSDG